MDENVRATLVGALGHVFQPMVRLALRNGLSYEDFCQDLKKIFVETAMQDFDVDGRELTTSRMAILTGIDRTDVREAEDEIRRGLGSEAQRMARIAAVIDGWNQDSEFTGPYGIPLELSLEDGKGGFPELVRRYAGRIPPVTMLSELRRAGLVELRSNKKVRMVSRSFIAGQFRPDAIQRMGQTLGDLAETLEHNLSPTREGSPRFERGIYTQESLDPETAKQFEAFVSKTGQSFLEDLDNWLTEKEQERQGGVDLAESEAGSDGGSEKIGVGLFVYKHIDKDFFTPSDGEQERDEGNGTIN